MKREAHGTASVYLHAHVHAGDILDVAAPRGSFTLRAGEAPVLLLSAGVGATPVLAMLHQLVADRPTRHVWWLHGARDRSEHPFVAEVRALVAALPHGHSHVWYSRPAAGNQQGRDYETAGRLSTDLFGQLGVPRNADAYLCGPAAFMQELSTALVAFGLDRSRIRTEVLRRRARADAGRDPGRGAPAARARGRSRYGTRGVVRAQRHHHELGRALRESARAGRGVRRADALVVPDRRLPQLRERTAGRRGDLLAGAGRGAG